MAVVTVARPDYVGSITIDSELTDQFLELKVILVDEKNRFVRYLNETA